MCVRIDCRIIKNIYCRFTVIVPSHTFNLPQLRLKSGPHTVSGLFTYTYGLGGNWVEYQRKELKGLIFSTLSKSSSPWQTDQFVRSQISVGSTFIHEASVVPINNIQSSWQLTRPLPLGGGLNSSVYLIWVLKSLTHQTSVGEELVFLTCTSLYPQKWMCSLIGNIELLKWRRG